MSGDTIMMDPKRLWAKKPYRGSAPSVEEHCDDVREAALVVWKSIAYDLATCLGREAPLLKMLSAAAILHDIGKVNSAFQEMMLARPGSQQRQPVRHELISAWLLSDNEKLGKWFSGLRSADESWPIIWAIAGHHLKMGDPKHAENPAQPPPLFTLANTPDYVTISLSTLGPLLRKAATALDSDRDIPSLPDIRLKTLDEIEPLIDDFATLSYKAWAKWKNHEQVALHTALLKALLIAADVGASALVSNDLRPEDWIPAELGKRIELNTLDVVIHKGTKGQVPLHFQAEVEAAGKRAVVIAGCGNGKTTAAYMWARRHAVGRKLWFTYPTTGTASAGFEDYVFRQPELESVLIHGRSDVDMKAMKGTHEDGREDEHLRLESLETWKSRAIVCTVDSVLGLMQNQRRPLFSFPSLVAGAVVFDEIHSYDTRMFGGLLRFLKTFPGLPVLLMSASIPPARLAAIQQVLGSEQFAPILGDEVLEGYQRYRLQQRTSEEACREEVKQTLGEGKKVLWVCNTVSDAIRTAQDAREWAGVEPIIYHSRFRYRNRVKRQQDVVGEFKYHTEGELKGQRKKSGASLVIATQVCEMSLDISADLLVTAECPLPSLVQRLGRLNRYAKTDDPWTCLVYPFQGQPYSEKPTDLSRDYRIEMAATRDLIAAVAGQPLSQKDLSERLKNMFVNEEFQEHSAWLDGGWLTVPAPVRDAEASVTVIREEDLGLIEAELGKEHAKPSRWNFRSLVPWTIPMNTPGRLRSDGKAGGYPVAALGNINYCEKEGATWQTNKA
jgi:CRISPR-associated endonuclease/helicase Cas3